MGSSCKTLNSSCTKKSKRGHRFLEQPHLGKEQPHPQCVRLHGGRGRVPGRAVWKRCREPMEAARAPAAPQRVPLLAVQVGWLGPLKRVENAPKSALPRAFSFRTHAKSATQTSREPRDPTTQDLRPGRRVESPVAGV